MQSQLLQEVKGNVCRHRCVQQQAAVLQCCSVWTSVAVRINASRPRHLQCCSAAHRQHEFSRILIFLHQDEKYLFFCLLQLPRQRDVTAAARYEAASGACCSFTFTVVREMQSSEPCCTLYCRYTGLSSKGR